MKATTPAATLADEARTRLKGWLAVESPETVAGWIGCSVRSVENWRDGKRMSRLSAKSVLAVKARK